MHCFDAFLWIIQWFTISRIIIFYQEWEHICTDYYQPNDEDGVEQLCDANFYCSFTSQKCNASTVLYVIYVFMVCCISIAAFLEVCRVITIILIGCHENMELNEYRIRLCGNSVFLRILQIPKWKDRYWISIIHEYYYKRKMFGFEIHEDSLIITYYIIRYLAFFGGSLTFYGIYYSDPAGLKWWEVIPVIIVWLFNEVLLIPHYKLMPIYDEHKHCVWIIYKIYGEEKIANIIMDYVGINYCKDNEEEDDDEMQHLRDDSSVSMINLFFNLAPK